MRRSTICKAQWQGLSFLAAAFFFTAILPNLWAQEIECEDEDIGCLRTMIAGVRQRALDCRQRLDQTRSQLTTANNELASSRLQLEAAQGDVRLNTERLAEVEDQLRTCKGAVQVASTGERE